MCKYYDLSKGLRKDIYDLSRDSPISQVRRLMDWMRTFEFWFFNFMFFTFAWFFFDFYEICFLFYFLFLYSTLQIWFSWSQLLHDFMYYFLKNEAFLESSRTILGDFFFFFLWYIFFFIFWFFVDFFVFLREEKIFFFSFILPLFWF